MSIDVTRRRLIGAAMLSITLPAPARPARLGRLMFIGTQGNGIYAAEFDDGGFTLRAPPAAVVERPTWVIAHPRKRALYAVSEIGNDGKTQGRVFSFAVDPSGGLLPLSAVDSGGGGPTHLAIDPISDTLFAAHYGSGHVSALPIRANAAAGAVVSARQDIGSGPGPRQRSAHAHGSALDPSGRVLAVADLGADRVFLYRFDRGTRTLAPGPAALDVPAGHGPRHLAFDAHGRFLFLITELVPELRVYRWDARRSTATLVETRSTLAAPLEKASGAELRLSADGRFVYVSNRVEDSIAGYAVDPATGRLREIARVTTDRSPWSFSIAPDGRWIVVANQGAGTITAHARDPASGRLAPASRSIAVEKPTSVAFL